MTRLTFILSLTIFIIAFEIHAKAPSEYPPYSTRPQNQTQSKTENSQMQDQHDQTDALAIPLDSSEFEDEQQLKQLQEMQKESKHQPSHHHYSY